MMLFTDFSSAAMLVAREAPEMGPRNDVSGLSPRDVIAQMCGCAARDASLTSNGELMRHRLLASLAAFNMLATSAYATGYDYEQRIVLMYGQIWNGIAITAVATFYSKAACEAGFEAYKKDSIAQITAARPGLSKQFAPIFWHACSPVNPSMPS